MKNNKRGLGADRVKKKIPKTSDAGASDGKDGNVSFTRLQPMFQLVLILFVNTVK